MGAHTLTVEIVIFEEQGHAFPEQANQPYPEREPVALPDYYDVTCEDPERLNAHLRATLQGALARGVLNVTETVSLQNELTPPTLRHSMRLSPFLASCLLGEAYDENLARFRADFGMPDSNEPLGGDYLTYIRQDGLSRLYDDKAEIIDGRLLLTPAEWDEEPEVYLGQFRDDMNGQSEDKLEKLVGDIEERQLDDVWHVMGLTAPVNPASDFTESSPWIKTSYALKSVRRTGGMTGVPGYEELGTTIGEFDDAAPKSFIPKMTLLTHPHFNDLTSRYEGRGLTLPKGHPELPLSRLGDKIISAAAADTLLDDAWEREEAWREQKTSSSKELQPE